MDPRAGLDVCGKSRLHRDSIPGPSSPYRVAIPTELPRLLCSWANGMKTDLKSIGCQDLGFSQLAEIRVR